MPPFRPRPALLLPLLGVIAAMPAWAFVTVGMIENRTKHDLVIPADYTRYQNLQFLKENGMPYCRGEDITLPHGAVLIVQATEAFLASEFRFHVTCSAGEAWTATASVVMGRSPVTGRTMLAPLSSKCVPEHPQGSYACLGFTQGSVLAFGSLASLTEALAERVTKPDSAIARASREHEEIGPGDGKAASGAGAGGAVESKASTGASVEPKGEGFASLDATLGAVQDQGLARIGQAILRWRTTKEDEPVRLVLGATPAAAERFGKGRWIFMDRAAHGADGAPFLQGDCNDLKVLKHLAMAVAGQLDAIHCDHSLGQRLAWTPDHLWLLRSMLRPNGELFIPFEFSPTVTSLDNLPKSAVVEDISVGSQPVWYGPSLPVHGLVTWAEPERQLQHLQGVIKARIFPLLWDVFDEVRGAELLPDYLKAHPERKDKDAKQYYFICKVLP